VTPLLRVLVVEDHEPFRRVLCGLLRQHPRLSIVGEAADGLDAIRQAEALRPDLVTLDITLPGMDGLAVASRLREVVPTARLLFITNEPSLVVVEEAVARGARGYLYKACLSRNLRRVLDTILDGGQFASGALERIAQGRSVPFHRHDVLFGSSDAIIVNGLSRFVDRALREGSAVIALFTESHLESVRGDLRARDVDLDLATRERRFIPLNIDELLATVMVNGRPDPARFQQAAGELVAGVTSRAAREHPRLTACGECAPSLWAQGQLDAAIAVEELWDHEVASDRHVDTLCVYPAAARQEDLRIVRALCAAHTGVELR
jgi:CheY-like chemotaxis protein